MKRKLVRNYLLLALAFLFVFQLPMQAGAKEISDAPVSIKGVATVTDLTTGDVQNIELTDNELNTFNVEKIGNNYNQSVNVNFKIPQIGVMSDDGTDKGNGDVSANLSLNYDYDQSQGTIRINRLYGYWVPSNQFIMVDSRATGCHDGRPVGGKSLTKYPSSNSFSYSTGWGYVTYYPPENLFSGPRAYSDARIIVPGMGSGYMLNLNLTIDNPI